MCFHVVNHYVTVFLYDGTPGPDLDPRVVDLFCPIPKHRKSYFHGDAVTGKRKRRRIDGALFQCRDSFRVASDLNQSHITIRIESLPSENVTNQKIRE